MFERFTEKARRVIFFARNEASSFGSPTIDPEFLLLGLVREDGVFLARFFQDSSAIDSIRGHVDRHRIKGPKLKTSVGLPLSDDSKRVLLYASEESDRLQDGHIGTEHLLLGLLREESSFAARLLGRLGLELAGVHQQLAAEKLTPPSLPAGLEHKVPSPRKLVRVGDTWPVPKSIVPSIRALDLPATIAFYVALGFEPVRGSEQEGVRVMQHGISLLALFESRLGEQPLCFQVEVLADAVAELRQAGVTVEPGAVQRQGVLLRDPNGNPVYILGRANL